MLSTIYWSNKIQKPEQQSIVQTWELNYGGGAKGVSLSDLTSTWKLKSTTGRVW